MRSLSLDHLRARYWMMSRNVSLGVKSKDYAWAFGILAQHFRVLRGDLL